MAYYSKQTIIEELEKNPFFKTYLYCRGFLITDKDLNIGVDYPFYGNWAKVDLDKYYIYFDKKINTYTYTSNNASVFIIGHAYDPFNMVYDENEILKNLHEKLLINEPEFWNAEANLTGVYCIGFIVDNNIHFSNDCAGMQLVYYGSINNNLYISSHSKLIADLLDLKQDQYITNLVNSKFYHYWGTWLPGDLSPYKELKRLQPNFEFVFDYISKSINFRRYYPINKISTESDLNDYNSIINKLCKIMHNNLELISKKWSCPSISVTGGKDSLTTLSCANGLYDKFNYFSYISNYDESVDAKAAHSLCNKLNLNHSIYKIPDDGTIYSDIDTFKMIMECNAGCIGENNYNDLKKRLYFIKQPKFNVEVKSWVNEIGRGWYYNKYNKKKFPKRPYASYLRAMHKVYLDPKIIKQTDQVFSEYLSKYYSDEVFEKISWLDLFFWEFSWSGGEGIFLTAEHRTAYEITIPFNNRKYVELMLSTNLQKRINDKLPIDIITKMNPNIIKYNTFVKDVSHTDFRAFIIRTYLEIFSKIKF